MLIRKEILERIAAGNVSLAFRRWRRPTVKSGSTLQTAVGVLSIQRIQEISLNAITESDAQRAGYPSLNMLLGEIEGWEGQVYRIELAYAGEDPRIALRQNDALTEVELDEIVSRLQRLDARSPAGSWTETVLLAIEANPLTAAGTIASHTGLEKEWLKTNIRKLKNLGLTISHHPGYELSPRGIMVLNHLRKTI